MAVGLFETLRRSEGRAFLKPYTRSDTGCINWPQYLLVSSKSAAIGFRPPLRCEVTVRTSGIIRAAIACDSGSYVSWIKASRSHSWTCQKTIGR